eukprot:3984188-Pleurochrysis_carterae.AAC.3
MAPSVSHAAHISAISPARYLTLRAAEWQTKQKPGQPGRAVSPPVQIGRDEQIEVATIHTNARAKDAVAPAGRSTGHCWTNVLPSEHRSEPV